MNTIVFSYTTKEAVEDGVLIKIDSGILTEIGIKFPVYLTDTVYRRYVEVPAGFKDFQDLTGRLFDVLYMFANTAKNSDSGIIYYWFTCLLRKDATTQANEKKSQLSKHHKDVRLKAIIGTNDIDDASPAIFIMLPSED